VVVGTCSLAAWDEPSARSSFPSLFLGVILWVFFRAHTRWVPILGLESHGAIEHQRGWNENDEHDKKTRSEWHEFFCQAMRASGRSPCGSIYSLKSNGLLQCLKSP
jgi:ABC-type dipeptide/oligopeptide/nickel transport system permease component